MSEDRRESPLAGFASAGRGREAGDPGVTMTERPFRGYVNLRGFRPLPSEELSACLGRFKGVGVIDRDFAHGSPDNGGILMHEVRSCLYPLRERPNVINYMGGLGGRDISIEECIRMYEETLAAGRGDMPEEIVSWTGLRE